MSVAASRMSMRCLSVSGCIERAEGRGHAGGEDRVFDRAGGHKINRASEDDFEFFSKGKLAVRNARCIWGVKLDDKVEIAFFGIEVVVKCGAKQPDFGDLRFDADALDFVHFLKNEGWDVMLWFHV